MPRVLIAIITGGRPALEERPTRLFLTELAEAGLADIEWIVRDDHAGAYERDEHPLNIYPVTWATAYAKNHWRHPTAIHQPGGFFGAFPGREWAMRTAEDRDYDFVVQMDDNITTIGLLNSTQPAYRTALTPAACVHALIDLCSSTNAYMVGAQLSSVLPQALTTVIRPGYPYSLFVERTGPGRMPYYGPFEDDIMHALEYGLHGGPHRTAAVVETIRYKKEHNTQTNGMRKHYDATRGLEIARRYPKNVTLRVGPKSSSPKETERGIRHYLSTRGFTPVHVTNLDTFHATEQTLRDGVTRALTARREWNQAKITRRATTTRR